MGGGKHVAVQGFAGGGRERQFLHAGGGDAPAALAAPGAADLWRVCRCKRFGIVASDAVYGAFREANGGAFRIWDKESAVFAGCGFPARAVDGDSRGAQSVQGELLFQQRGFLRRYPSAAALERAAREVRAGQTPGFCGALVQTNMQETENGRQKLHTLLEESEKEKLKAKLELRTNIPASNFRTENAHGDAVFIDTRTFPSHCDELENARENPCVKFFFDNYVGSGVLEFLRLAEVGVATEKGAAPARDLDADSPLSFLSFPSVPRVDNAKTDSKKLQKRTRLALLIGVVGVLFVPFFFAVTSMIKDRELGLKEGLKCVGVYDSTYYLQWVVSCAVGAAVFSTEPCIGNQDFRRNPF